MGEADRGKLGLLLMDGAMFNKSVIQFSVDGWSCVPSLGPSYGGRTSLHGLDGRETE